ncbi:MAG: hypothetical protein Q9217_006987 [Psora testacea]
MGGRPSRPIQYEPGHWVHEEGVDDCISEEEDDEQKELRWVSDHWGHEGSHIRGELLEWQGFRKFQRQMRRKPASLYKVQQRINEYWKKKQIKKELRPKLHVDPDQQSKVEEWKEFYWYQHRGLRWHDEDVKKRERRKEEWLQKFDAAPSDPKESGEKWLHGEWQDREGIVKRSDRLIGAAQNFRKSLMDRLDWIEGQLSVIALECWKSDQVSEDSFLPAISAKRRAFKITSRQGLVEEKTSLCQKREATAKPSCEIESLEDEGKERAASEATKSYR